MGTRHISGAQTCVQAKHPLCFFFFFKKLRLFEKDTMLSAKLAPMIPAAWETEWEDPLSGRSAQAVTDSVPKTNKIISSQY